MSEMKEEAMRIAKQALEWCKKYNEPYLTLFANGPGFCETNKYHFSVCNLQGRDTYFNDFYFEDDAT